MTQPQLSSNHHLAAHDQTCPWHSGKPCPACETIEKHPPAQLLLVDHEPPKVYPHGYPAVEPRGNGHREKCSQSWNDLVAEYGLDFQPEKDGWEPRHWRMLYPERGNVKGLPHYGDMVIRATDGTHALAEIFWADGARPLVLIHLTNFTGEVRSQSWTPKLPKPRGRPKKKASELKRPRRKKKKKDEVLEELKALLKSNQTK